MNKKIILSLLLTVFTSVSVFAYKSYIFDEADILTVDEEEDLNNQIQSVIDKHNGELAIYVATVGTYSDYAYNVEEFAEYFYKQSNLGVGNNNTGLLFVLSMEEREYDICAYGDFSHTTFTDYGKEKLAAAALPYFRNDNWCDGFAAYVSKADKMLAMSDNGNPLDVGSVYFDSRVLITSILIACIAGLIIGLIVALVLHGKMNNVKAAKSANNYVSQDDVKITNKIDRFTHNVVTRAPINQNNNPGGGGRPGGTSINSGGFSHSSGKF